jgi:hypothetical protein
MSMRGTVAKSGANLRRRTIRRRVIALGVAGVTIAGAQIGVSMLGDTGTVESNISTSTVVSKRIYASSLPPQSSGVSKWAATGATSAPVRVTWQVAPNYLGTVGTAGDVAIIDATTAGLPAGSSGVAVTMFISNLTGFAKNYSTFALPVGVYRWTGGSTGVWEQFLDANSTFYNAGNAGNPNTNALFIQNTDGQVTFNLPNGAYYEVVIDKAGFWQSQASPAAPDLGPQFFLTADVY